MVIPSDRVGDKLNWKNSIEDTYGIAYGEDDIINARQTRPLMFDYINKQNELNIENAKKLVKLCEEKI